jgi:lysozyme
MRARLIAMLVRHEGLRLTPYRDTVGKLTIGVGRNLDDVGISKEEAMFLLQNDLAKAERSAGQFIHFFANLDEARQAVVISMIFNMGIFGLMKFSRFLQAMEKGDFDTASEEMLSSLWADQVGNRAVELATMMKEGKFQAKGV